jgi:predicted O-methyltransferase YrrM
MENAKLGLSALAQSVSWFWDLSVSLPLTTYNRAVGTALAKFILPGVSMSISKRTTIVGVTVLLVLLIVGLGLTIVRINTLAVEMRKTLDDLPAGQTSSSNAKTYSSQQYELQVAREDTARFVNANLQSVKTFYNRYDLLSFCVKQAEAKANGLFCEFGVYRGESVNHIASQTKATVHGFDSFEGLPEKWREGFDKGTFGMDGLPRVRENVVLHKGWFDQSVPVFAAKYQGSIAFLHMDADLYSSTKTVFDLLGKRIIPGAVIVFDEFLGYPGWQNGEYKAFQELVQERHFKFDYIGRVPNYNQVAVQISGIGSAE